MTGSHAEGNLKSAGWDLRRTASFLCLLLGLSASACARDLYVDRSHPRASDANPGTEALPLLTVGRAAARARAGDTVRIKAGFYPEPATVLVVRSGTAMAPITIRAHGDGRVVLDGSALPAGAELVRWKFPGADHVRLQGLELQGAPDVGVWVEGSWNRLSDLVVRRTGSTGILVRRGTHNTFSRLEIHHTGWNGIDLEDSEHSTIDWCDIHDTPRHNGINIFPAPGGRPWYGTMSGIRVRHTRVRRALHGIYLRHVTDLELSNNVITGCSGWGIYFHHQEGRPARYDAAARLFNNTIADNAWEGLHSQSADGLVLRNNLFRNLAGRALRFGDTGGHSLDYNLYDPGGGALARWAERLYDLESFRAFGHERHGAAGACAFNGAADGDYSLSFASAAVDAGADLSGYGLVDDIEGRRRPQGRAYDLGAFERSAGPAPGGVPPPAAPPPPGPPPYRP